MGWWTALARWSVSAETFGKPDITDIAGLDHVRNDAERVLGWDFFIEPSWTVDVDTL
jgi:hypothetical protein